MRKEQEEGAYRYSRYTPAVTSVEEWTNAETGVGASMADGSHAEKGTCADLVKLMANTIQRCQAKGPEEP